MKNIWGSPTIGENTKIAEFVEIGDKVIIGKNVKIQAFTFIPTGVIIEDDVFVGPHVCFTNDKYPTNEWSDRPILQTKVEEGANIGAGAVILPGITIGRFSNVGAGSVVTKDVQPHTTVIGNPARQI